MSEVILLHSDFETASMADLTEVGLDNYARHPSTRVLMLSVAKNDDEPWLWLPHLRPEMPAGLRRLLNDENVYIVAHNAQFERAIFKHVLGIDIPARRFICTQSMAATLSLPLDLSQLTHKALAFGPEFAKDKRGDALIRRFSIPRPANQITAKKPWTFNDWNTHPDEWRDFCNYCNKDVKAERKAFKIMKRYIPDFRAMHELWVYDQEINETGYPLDRDFIEGALQIIEAVQADYFDRMAELTGLQNPNSVQQALAWLQERGYPFASLKKDRVKIAVRDFGKNMTEDALKFIDLRLQSSKSSLKKFPAMLRAMAVDGRLRYTLQFCGASRTGRWAGRIAQLQNLPRPWKDVEPYLNLIRQMIRDGDHEMLTCLFGRPLDALSSSIRSTIAAPEGKVFNIADLSAIELCVIAWLTGSKFWLDVLREKKDPYKAFGVHYLGVPYDEITKSQRNECKPAALGAGYRLGGGKEVGEYPDIQRTGLWAYAESMGVNLSKEQAHEAVRVYRELSPEVVQFWYDIENACKDCINDGETRRVGMLVVDLKAPFLRIRLPSGRYLFYCRPRVEKRTTEYENDDGTVTKRMSWNMTYEGTHQQTKAWVRMETHGGKLIENCLSEDTLVLTPCGTKRIVDVGSRDLLWDGEHWVAHDGLVYKGVRETIAFGGGIRCTPDHRIDVDTNWVNAGTTGYEEAASSFGRHYRTPKPHAHGGEIRRVGRQQIPVAGEVRLRQDDNHGGYGVAQRTNQVVRMRAGRADLAGSVNARHEQASGVLGVALDERPVQKPETQGVSQLRREGDNGLRKVAIFVRELLGGYAKHVSDRLGHRPNEQQQRVSQVELPMGFAEGQHTQQTEQSDCGYSERQDAVVRSVRLVGDRGNNASVPSERQVAGVEAVRQARRNEQVFDLVNAGPNHRFTVVGDDGRLVLVHNCVQAIARDVLVEGLLESRKRGFDVIGHVHDEIITEADIGDEEHNSDALVDAMTVLPKWAEGLPLSAAGFASDFYKKD